MCSGDAGGGMFVMTYQYPACPALLRKPFADNTPLLDRCTPRTARRRRQRLSAAGRGERDAQKIMLACHW